MVLPSINTFIIQLFNEVNVLLAHYVHNGYQALAGALKAPLGAAITLYTGLIIYYWYAGQIQLTTKQIADALIRVCLIYMLAMNWDDFSQYIVSLIQSGADLVGTTLLKATPLHVPNYKGQGIEGTLQLTLISFMQFAGACMKLGSWNNLVPYFDGLIIYGVGAGLTLMACIELILAKVFLAILFALAPLFVSFALFKSTENLFTAWLRELIGYSLMMVFVSAVLGFVFSLIELLLPLESLEKLTDIHVFSSVFALILGFLGMYLLCKAAEQGKLLAGGFAISSANLLVLRAVQSVSKSSFGALSLPAGTASKVASMATSSLRYTGKMTNSFTTRTQSLRQSAREGNDK